MLQIRGVYTVCPAIADLGLEGSPGEVEPGLVEVGAALVGPEIQTSSGRLSATSRNIPSLSRADGVPRLIWPPQFMSRERRAKFRM
jgi:hypothetical protein